MKIDISGPDQYGNNAYEQLLRNIMTDLGKSVVVDRAKIFLEPKTPLFIFSVKLRTAPQSRTISDAATLRSEGDEVHISISDESFAPEILSALWKKYGRDAVDQQTRFDIIIRNADQNDIADIHIASGEDAKKEIIGTLWRCLPEGIKARHNISDGQVITIAATEEIMTDELKARAVKFHEEVKAEGDTEDV